MAIQLPKDPFHDFESVVIKAVGLLSTLIIVGDIAVTKFSHATLQVQVGVGGILVAFIGWFFLKRKD